MKNLAPLTLVLLLCCGTLFAQNGLGTNTPNPQAALDIQSPDKGVLMPHISLTASNTFLQGVTATASHVGMLVYNTNAATNVGLAGTGYYFWNGTQWEKFIGDTDLFTDLDGDTQFQVEEGRDDDTLRLDAAGVEVATFTVSDTTLANDLTVQGSSSLATTTLAAVLQDYEGDAGTVGQVLSSTGTSTNWISIATAGIIDADSDTQIQVEEGTDDDTIRFDTAGTERVVITNAGEVGIATATPSYTLDVNGTYRVLLKANLPAVTSRTHGGATFNGSPDYTVSDGIIYTTFTTGADITTTQTIYESGGSSVGTDFLITGGNFRVYAGSSGTIYITTPVMPNTAYSAAVVYDLTADQIRLYLTQAANTSLQASDLVATAPFTENDWAGTDFTGVGGLSGSNRAGISGNFTGTGLSQIDLFTTNDITAISSDQLPRLVVNTAGKVGVGTATPAQTLTVSGTAQVIGALYDSSGDAGTAGQVLSTTSTGTNWISNATQNIIDADGDTQIQVEEGPDDDTIRFDTAGTERVVIDNTGNVGIRTGTPSAPLDLAVTAETAIEFDNGDNIISIHDGSGNFNFKSGVDNDNLITASTGGSHLQLDEDGYISLKIDESTGVGNAFTTGLELLLNANRIQFLEGDAVAIGSRRSALTVQTLDNNVDAGLAFQNSGDHYTGAIHRTLATGSQADMAFSTGSANANVNSLQERMRITYTGNVGIGTSTPSQTLTVGGTAQVTGALHDSSGDAGTAGQVLSSTGTSTNWVDALKEAPGLTGIGQLTDGGSLVLDGAISAFVQGDYAYVVSNIDDAFQVIDISTPASPTVVGQLTDDGTLELNLAYGVFAQGNYAYVVSNSDDGFQVIDISDPTNPTGVGQLTDDSTLELNGARNVFVQGNYAYVVAYDDDGFQVIDISDPTKPTGVGQLTDGGALELDGAHGVFVQGNYAYVAARADDGFQVIDISDPTNPTGVGQLADSGSLALDEGTDVFVQGKYAYVAAYIDDGLQVIDISDPTNPTGVGQLTDSGTLALNGANSVFVQGNYAYVAGYLDDGLQVIDISDPTNPTGVGQLTDDGTLEMDGAINIFVQGNYAYVAGYADDGFQLIELGKNRLYGAEIGALAASSLQVDNHALFNNNSDIKGGLSVGASANIDGSLSIGKELIDADGDAGTAGQVLSSTGTSTNWMDSDALQDVPKLTEIGQLTDGGSLALNAPYGFFVQGNYAYVASDVDDGFQVIDISISSSPTGVGQLTDNSTLELNGARSAFAQGNYAYVAAYADDGFQVIDISNPASPTGVGQLTDSGALELDGAHGVFVQGNYAYVTARNDDGFQVIDISDPTNPTGVGQLTDSGALELDGAIDVFVQGNYAYVVGFNDDGFQVIDISDPTNPTGVGQLADSGSLALDGGHSVFVQGNYAYVAAYNDDGLQVIDISDPTNPTGVGKLTDDSTLKLDGAIGVYVQGNYAYVATFNEDAFQVIDISDPTNPTGVEQLADNGSLALDGAVDVVVQGNDAYILAYNEDGFQTIELGTNRLYGVEAGALAVSSLQVDNHAQFNNYIDVKGGLSVGASTNIDGSLSVDESALITGAVQLSNYGAGAVQSDANGNLSVSSDERLKNIVGDFERGLTEILALKPITFQWNAQSGLEQEGYYSGFSAQNVQGVIPEAVGQDQKGYLTLSDRPIIAAMVNAIKALEAKNKALEAALEALMKRLEALEAASH